MPRSLSIILAAIACSKHLVRQGDRLPARRIAMLTAFGSCGLGNNCAGACCMALPNTGAMLRKGINKSMSRDKARSSQASVKSR